MNARFIFTRDNLTAHGSTSYSYDAANRLIAVNGQAYDWDNNGNLLSDGVKTYTYDAANHLTGVSSSSYTYQYVYNGLGDRVKSILDGVSTTYVLDLNSGLTQVLADGSNTYLYGLSRIAQVNEETTGYFLGDGLGSVRQVADPEAKILLMLSYDPYGETTTSIGGFDTDYGYTGEQIDVSGLIYLRARYYDPSTGRFVTRDPFPGYLGYPTSQNGYSYAYNNPLLYTDPSGEIIPLLIAAGVGLVVGAGGDFLMQMISNGWNIHCIDWKSVLVSGTVGAISGLTGFALSSVLTAGIGVGLLATVFTGALVGAVTGAISRAVTNIMTGQNVMSGVLDLTEIGRDALIGGATAGLGYGIQKGLAAIAKSVLQKLTNAENAALSENLNLAKSVLSPDEYSAAQSSKKIAPMEYGNAVERLVGQNINQSSLGDLFEYVGGPNKVDFYGKSIFSGLKFDITTNTGRSIAAHEARSYGKNLLLVFYSRPQGFSVFP